MPIKPHKLGIIGVGRVGDAVLSDAMMSGLFGEICVIDVNEKLAAGQALDQHHATALPNVTNVAVYAGDYGDLSDADVIIVTAGPSIDASNGPATGAACAGAGVAALRLPPASLGWTPQKAPRSQPGYNGRSSARSWSGPWS